MRCKGETDQTAADWCSGKLHFLLHTPRFIAIQTARTLGPLKVFYFNLVIRGTKMDQFF